MSQDKEVSEGGSEILRHVAVDSPARVPDMSAPSLEAIAAHIRVYVGEPSQVFHEIVSDGVHIDIHIVPPSPQRDCYTLVTSGMSDLPMNVPSAAEDQRYAELLVVLPSDWTPGPLWEADLSDERVYWPVRLLKSTARLPHTYATWVGEGHTIPNGDPPVAYAPGTELCCALLLPPITVPTAFSALTIEPDKVIHFYAVVPLHADEMRYKLKRGTGALTDLFDKASISELLDPTRPSVVPRKRFLFF